MLQSGSCQCLVFLVLGALVFPGAADAAAPTLAQAIAETDAKYRDARELETKGASPRIEVGSGEEETPRGSQSIAQGPVKATLSFKETKTEFGEAARIPVVSVFADDMQIAQLEGEESDMTNPPVSVQIAEIDPANANPEVVVSFYTGGAHCCSDTKLLTSSKDGSRWRTIAVGEFDGGPMLASDLTGDGRYVFQTRDNVFLYAFACYACSTAPLKILAVEDGEVKTVSAEPRFRPAQEAYMKTLIAELPEDDVNGFLAGYVGEKILLGEGKQAWNLMLTHYDRGSDWGLDVCTEPLDAQGDCPGKTERLSFPQALERMLNDNGYKVEK
jgi:hypothetical protein